MDSFNQLTLDDVGYFNNDFSFESPKEFHTECLWKPLTVLEPIEDPIELQAIDEVADKVETPRPQSVGVIVHPGDYTVSLGKEPSAKMGHAEKENTPCSECLSACTEDET